MQGRRPNSSGAHERTSPDLVPDGSQETVKGPVVSDSHMTARTAEYYALHAEHGDGDLESAFLSGSPENPSRRAEIELAVGRPVTLIPGSPEEIAARNQARYGLGASSIPTQTGESRAASAPLDPIAAGGPEDGKITSDPDSHGTPVAVVRTSKETAATVSPSSNIAEFVDRLLHNAYADRATDLHIEPYERTAEIRYRIDGVLHMMSVPPNLNEFHRQIVSRLKILAQLDIAEHRLPQDGRFRFATAGAEELDVRVSILPTAHGEAVDLRILSGRQLYTGLEFLGLSDEDEIKARDVLQRPHGVVLVTGPTGSGKTTSLYAFLRLLNQADRKIVTIEDPIEYQIDGITQVQVHPKIGLTFARGLRSMLRHDPDIMMVGEIRDQETAETTVQVALTGHLVFSTVHTNDAPSTPTRLINMGIEPYLVASSLECVIAQRLVRLICEHCMDTIPVRDSDPVAAAAMAEMEQAHLDSGGRLAVGRGCSQCMETGYRGRTAIYEFLPISEAIQELILTRSPARVLRVAAEREGFQTMRRDGLKKVALGRTTYEEVVRVTRKSMY